ncbi:MAG: IS1380 family transposase [Chloroflexi bacterium]|nr:IS1380 family transposase [Chloroflexota bacterium]
MHKPLPRGLNIEFEGGLEEAVTAHAGVALLIELGRLSGVIGAADRCLPVKKSSKGLGQGQFVESFVLLSALGGECLDDFYGLRRDQGLEAMLGYPLPPASTARQWLDQFHDETLLEGRPLQGSFIPMESARLAALRAVVERTIHAYVAAVRAGPMVTLDVDAHLVESSKYTALPSYAGFRGYQPLLVQWAEAGLILADQFRDGNVPASQNIRQLVDEAYDSLPPREDGWQVQVRSDSAAYEYETLDHWHERGWRFVVSADMSPSLRAQIQELPPQEWHFWSEGQDGVVREWAEVPYVPSRPNEHRDTEPYRYVAIRVRTPQGVLFGDGNTVKLFAVVSNDWDTDGRALLEWHRGKAATIEQVHRVLKDELGAGVYPSAKFGANAAWLRLQVLTHNLLELLKATALDEQYREARPKRLRFRIFTQFGRVVNHARKQFIRLASRVLREIIRPGRRRLAGLAWTVS